MTFPSATGSAGKSLSALTANGVAMLRVLRHPRSLPQIVNRTAQRGDHLGAARVETTLLSHLGAGYVVPVQRTGEVLYKRTRVGKQALRAALLGRTA